MAKKKIPDDCLPRCSSCAFFESEPAADAGYCRRFPPVLIAADEGAASAFPAVEVEDWCGEFRRRCN